MVNLSKSFAACAGAEDSASRTLSVWLLIHFDVVSAGAAEKCQTLPETAVNSVLKSKKKVDHKLFSSNSFVTEGGGGGGE